MAIKMATRKADYLDFFKTVGESKRLLRSGWVREKINDPESVAEHSFRVSVLAMVLSDKLGENLDKNKLIQMAILHDLGELITGDIVAQRHDIIDVKKTNNKEKKEKEGIRKVFGKVGLSKEYVEIFEEMINRTTPEAKVFWEFDKLEMALQALEYEEEQGKNLEEFFVNTDLYMRNPVLKGIFDRILKERRKQ